MAEGQETTVIGVRVAQSRRAELEEYVEEHDEHDTVPSLFRTAVAHELSDDYGPNTGGASGGTGGSVGDVTTEVSRLRGDIEDLSDEINALADEVRGGDRSQIVERMSAVHRELPDDPERGIDYTEVASRFEDMDTETAWYTLMQLYEEIPSVHRTTDGKWYTE